MRAHVLCTISFIHSKALFKKGSIAFTRLSQGSMVGEKKKKGNVGEKQGNRLEGIFNRKREINLVRIGRGDNGNEEME